MIEMSHKITSTVVVSPADEADFYALSAIVGQVFAQAGIGIRRIDLGLRGDSIDYETDHGRIEITGRRREDGVRQIGVTCNTLVTGTREIGRQICFQITRRLISRLTVTSVFWQPTRQRVLPEHFTWGCLSDAPQRYGAASARVVPTHYGSALM